MALQRQINSEFTNEAINCTNLELLNYLQALVEGYYPVSCSDINASVQSRSIRIASKSWCNGKKTGFFPGFQFSLTLENSMEGGLGDSPILYPAGSRSCARTFPVPEKESESKEADQDFGKRWPGSLARYDRASHSWKTPHSLPEGDSMLFSGIWPKWGILRGMWFWGLTRLERLTSEKGSGYWPTPTTMDHVVRKRMRPSRAATGRTTGYLSEAILCVWPTPCSEDSQCAGGHRGQDDTLYGAVCRPKDNQTKAPGQLNPSWVEWLMNFPIGWSSLDPLPKEAFDTWKKSKTWWTHEPADVLRVATGVKDRVNRLKALGNGQVPLCAVKAWQTLHNLGSYAVRDFKVKRKKPRG